MDYSVVVPAYNEEGNIKLLHNEIISVMKKLGKTYEVIYVNDGSKDSTFQELKKLKGVIIINLNRNYGQSTALDAGFKASQGNIVISMDGDMQNDPHDIPRLLAKMKAKNLDVVAGWRVKRKDKAGIRILTRTSRLIRRIMLGNVTHDSGCTLRVYKKEAVKSLDLWGEMHRYILALLRWKGFRIGELPVNHRPRKHGKTKYNYSKALRGFIDLIYIWFINKYSSRSLHLFGSIGLLSFATGALIEAWMIIGKLFFSYDLSSNGWFILGIFLIVAGFLSFSLGIITDLLIRIHLNNSPSEKRYYIRDIIRT
jgi:glycosyltransferase involved in cell wall biosynthesis